MLIGKNRIMTDDSKSLQKKIAGAFIGIVFAVSVVCFLVLASNLLAYFLTQHRSDTLDVPNVYTLCPGSECVNDDLLVVDGDCVSCAAPPSGFEARLVSRSMKARDLVDVDICRPLPTGAGRRVLVWNAGSSCYDAALANYTTTTAGIDALDATLQAWNDSIVAADAQVTATSAQIANCSGENDANNATLNAIDVRLTAAQSDITTADTDLDALFARQNVTVASIGTGTPAVNGTFPAYDIVAFIAGPGVTFETDATTLRINSTLPAIDTSNVTLTGNGAGEALPVSTTGPSLTIKGFDSTTVPITEQAQTVTFAPPIALTALGGESLVASGTGAGLTLRSIDFVSPLAVSVSDTLNISNTFDPATVSLTSAGGAASFVADGVGPDLEVRDIKDGSGVSMSTSIDGMQIEIVRTARDASYLNETTPGGTISLVSDGANLVTKRINCDPSSCTLTPNATDITINGVLRSECKTVEITNNVTLIPSGGLTVTPNIITVFGCSSAANSIYTVSGNVALSGYTAPNTLIFNMNPPIGSTPPNYGANNALGIITGGFFAKQGMVTSTFKFTLEVEIFFPAPQNAFFEFSFYTQGELAAPWNDIF